MYDSIIKSLSDLYILDSRPWVVGYSGGKDSTMLVSLVFEALATISPKARTKEIAVVCTDTRVEIPAVVERVAGELEAMNKASETAQLGVTAHLLKPPAEQSFWVNMLGRGYPPPNRSFRWCTQRMKIDPVSDFIRSKLGHWGEAIILIGARKSESGSRAQTLGSRAKKEHGLRHHDDLPRCWISTPIEEVSTMDVWDYLMGRLNPWGGDNQGLYQLYKDASGGECPLVVDQTTPSCGNSRFGCWTCTVVDRDKASEGLLASGDTQMKQLLEFRETLVHFRDPENGFRDMVRKNGAEGPGPLKLESRKELLTKLIALEEETGLSIISEEELHWIQKFWNSARGPDSGNGVASILSSQRGYAMPSDKENDRLSKIEQEIVSDKGISLDTLRRLVSKVEEYGESHRAVGLQDEILQILQDDLRERTEVANA